MSHKLNKNISIGGKKGRSYKAGESIAAGDPYFDELVKGGHAAPAVMASKNEAEVEPPKSKPSRQK